MDWPTLAGWVTGVVGLVEGEVKSVARVGISVVVVVAVILRDWKPWLWVAVVVEDAGVAFFASGKIFT